MEFLAILAFYFHSYCISKTTVSFVFLKPLLPAFKCILHAQYEKKYYQNNNIFHNIGANLTQILPQRPHSLFFFFLLISNELC